MISFKNDLLQFYNKTDIKLVKTDQVGNPFAAESTKSNSLKNIQLPNDLFINNTKPKNIEIINASNNKKFDAGEAFLNFGKGFISPITGMFSSPENFIAGSGMILATAGLTIATGGAILPFMAAAGVATGLFQAGTAISKVVTAKNGDDIEKAFYDAGAATSTLIPSIGGAKIALTKLGVDVSKMNTLEAVVQTFKKTPDSLIKSFNMFKDGTALINLKAKIPFINNKAKLEVESKAKTEAENKAKLEAESKAKAEAENKAKLEAESKAKTEAENKAKLEAESKAKTEAENKAKLEKKQIKYNQEMKAARDFIDQHRAELDVLFGEEITTIDPDSMSIVKVKKQELIKPYNQTLDTVYHGTSEAGYKNIIENGFDIHRVPVHGYQHTGEGAYFMLEKSNGYGSNIIEAKFKGKIAEVNSDMINGIKTNWHNTSEVRSLLTKYGIKDVEAETILSIMTNEMLKNEGYTGIITSDFSIKAGGIRYFQALDPSCIEILNPKSSINLSA